MIYVFLAEGFEEIEALATVDVLRRAGGDVRTVGVGGREVTGAHGVRVSADLEEAEIEPEKAEMIVLPGGPGTSRLERSEAMRRAVLGCIRNQRYVAAICAAPSILGHMGLLKEHIATCFPGYEPELHARKVSEGPVCVSGKIITARGPGVSVEFALKLVEILFGIEKSTAIGKSMQCT